MKKRIRSCEGKPSANQYSNGCRCAGCTEAWRVHHMEDRYGKKRKSVRRDTPIVEHDAFTREQILKARGMM